MSSLLLPCELQGSNSKAAGLTVSAFIGRVLSLAPKQGFERQGAHVLLNHGASMLEVQGRQQEKKLTKTVPSSIHRPGTQSADRSGMQSPPWSEDSRVSSGQV